MHQEFVKNLNTVHSARLATRVAGCSPTKTSFAMAELMRQDIVVSVRSPFRYALARPEEVNNAR